MNAIAKYLEAVKKATEYDTPELLDSEIDDLADDVQRMKESAEKYGEDPYGGLRGLSRDLARMRELREYRNAAKEIEELRDWARAQGEQIHSGNCKAGVRIIGRGFKDAPCTCGLDRIREIVGGGV